MFSTSPNHFQSIGTGFSIVAHLNNFIEPFKYQVMNINFWSTTRSWQNPALVLNILSWFCLQRRDISSESTQIDSWAKIWCSSTISTLYWWWSEISDLVKISEKQSQQHLVRSSFLLAPTFKYKSLYDLGDLVSPCFKVTPWSTELIFRKTLSEKTFNLDENDRCATYAWSAQSTSFAIFDLVLPVTSQRFIGIHSNRFLLNHRSPR